MRPPLVLWRWMRRIECWRYDHTWFRKSDGTVICSWCLLGHKRRTYRWRDLP